MIDCGQARRARGNKSIPHSIPVRLWCGKACAKQVLAMSSDNGYYTEFRCCTINSTCTILKHRQAWSRSCAETCTQQTWNLYHHRSLVRGAFVLWHRAIACWVAEANAWYEWHDTWYKSGSALSLHSLRQASDRHSITPNLGKGTLGWAIWPTKPWLPIWIIYFSMND